MKAKMIKHCTEHEMLLTPLWSWTTKSGDRIWKCRCKCGNTCYAKESALKNGITKDCGCKSTKISMRYITKNLIRTVRTFRKADRNN